MELSVAVDDGETPLARATLRPPTALVVSRLRPEPHAQTLAPDVNDAVAASRSGALVAAQEPVRVEDVVPLVPASERRSVVSQLVQESRGHGRVAA